MYEDNVSVYSLIYVCVSLYVISMYVCRTVFFLLLLWGDYVTKVILFFFSSRNFVSFLSNYVEKKINKLIISLRDARFPVSFVPAFLSFLITVRF